MVELQENTFQCPGETYTISRAVHLGRLAAFDQRCRHCSHRQDTGSLPTGLVEQLQSLWKCDEPSLFGEEGVAGLVGETLNANTSRRLGAAFGTMLGESQRKSPAVVLAGDGRPATADLVAAASDGLRWSGCHVIEVPAATAACLVFTQQHLAATGALLVGNAAGTPRTASLRFFGPGGEPVSAEASVGQLTLGQLQHKFEQELNRPARQSGGWQRGTAEQEYLATLLDYFHALRPLRFVFETACAPLRRYLDRLLVPVACRAISPAEAAQLPAESVHFSFWADGDGERYEVRDEQGHIVKPHRVLALLASDIQTSRAGVVVIEEQTPDALHVLALLLSILSQSDRPLSAIA